MSSIKKSPVTLQQVADAADVHISTVSRALDPAKANLVNAKTRARVVRTAAKLGYRPHLIASQLRRGQTWTVGVVVPDLGNPLYAPFVRGVIHALERHEYVPLVADTQDRHDRFERTLLHLWNRRVDGIITTAPRTQDRTAVERVASLAIPVILAIRTLPESNLPSVQHDDVRGGRMAARHLIDLGHTRLVQVQGPMDVTPFIRRTQGFADTVNDAGVELVDLGMAGDDPTIDEGRRLTEALLERPGPVPTGIFAQNDLIALGTLEALRHAGLRCPEDVSVIGYNNSFYAAHSQPPLTTIDLPDYDMGQVAASVMIDYIERPERASVSASTMPRLIIRGSTGPPPRR